MGDSGQQPPPDGENKPPPTVVAARWATRITTVSLMMVVPGLIGYWVDLQLGIKPALTITGFALGMTAGMYQLIRMTSPPTKK